MFNSNLRYFILLLSIAPFLNAETYTDTYNYTGSSQKWVVPAGVYSVNFEIAGARGQNSGEAGYNGGYPSAGGKGGSVSGDLQVTPGETLYINIGGMSGWNGGGNGGAFDAYPSLFNSGGAGGGGSDIRIATNDINQRVVVGGGGGGGLTTYWCCMTPARQINGGAGGYPAGGNAPYISHWYASSGGGSQTSGCALFQGCNGPYSGNVWGAGGGGGYYGGRALSGSSGGGGSSYFNQDLTTDVTYENGVNAGDGYLVLVYQASQLGATTVNTAEIEAVGRETLSANLVFDDPNGLGNFSLSAQPANGVLTFGDIDDSGIYTQLIIPVFYTATQGFTGLDQFTLTLTDSLSASTEITLTVDVLSDVDADGISDQDDSDDDNDGVDDNSDAFPLDPSETVDTDGDGVGDNADLFPLDPSETVDTDGDGVGDNADASPLDPSETVDTDGDGMGDNADLFPLDPSETVDADGDGIGNNADNDDDNDGVTDSTDAFPLDSSESLDTDGDGLGNNTDSDDDSDGVEDQLDAFPLDSSETVDTDGDGVGNNADPDDDNDGYLDAGSGEYYEASDVRVIFSPINNTTEIVAGAELIESLGDFNLFDLRFGGYEEFEFRDDVSGHAYRFTSVVYDQGVISTIATPLDTSVNSSPLPIRFYPEIVRSDEDFISELFNVDEFGPAESLGLFSIQVGEEVSDADAFPLDASEWQDSDSDGVGDNSDVFPDDSSEFLDTDGDGIGDNADNDDDNDGVIDSIDAFPLDSSESLDTDGDGLGNNTDSDDDSDGVEDQLDAFPLDSSETVDTDGDGVGNNADPDDDNDGYLDAGSGEYYEASDVRVIFSPINNTTEIVAGAELIESLGDFNLFDLRFGGYEEFEFRDDVSGHAYRFTSVVYDQGVISTIATPLDTSVNSSPLPIRFYPEIVRSDEEFISELFNVDEFGSADSLGLFSIQVGEEASDPDAFPLDASEWQDSDSDGQGNNADTDDDNDDIEDSLDAFPLDEHESVDTDSDGVGNNADTDDDNDDVEDNLDAFPLDEHESVDTDSDGVGNNTDTDDDNDDVEDNLDAFPFDEHESVDTDSDGVGNNADTDDDNDGFPDFALFYAINVSIDDVVSRGPAIYGFGVSNGDDPVTVNNSDEDWSSIDPSEPEGIYQSFEMLVNGGQQSAHDVTMSLVPGTSDEILITSDNPDLVLFMQHSPMGDQWETLNGVSQTADFLYQGVEGARDAFPLDASEWLDTDSDGVGDNADAFDNDPSETTDTDGDGVGDNADVFDNDPSETTDSDGDGVGDNADAFIYDPNETTDTDADGIGNNVDTDDDGDGVDDVSDAFPLNAGEILDTDSDGVGNNADTDDDNDGVLDVVDLYPLSSGTHTYKLLDIDANGEIDALSDGLLVMRYLFDFSGDALVNNAVGDGATRTDSTEIEMYLESLMNKF